jgi:hypothetical protein
VFIRVINANSDVRPKRLLTVFHPSFFPKSAMQRDNGMISWHEKKIIKFETGEGGKYRLT